jgi:shikimate dehydrogenase
MTSTQTIAAVQPYITNRLDNSVVDGRLIAGIIGDGPSQYSKSPSLWNAAFRYLNIGAVYLPFDVGAAHLAALLGLLKADDRFLGLNVTVPHKVRVMDFLDDLDPGAKRIEAVNTIVHMPQNQLVGFNTDGAGFIESILRRQPGRSAPFVESLNGMNVLLLGAGGSARAVAFHVAERLGSGRLLISNRTVKHAIALADAVKANGGNAEAIHEAEITKFAPAVGLIINSTTKGQGGLRKLPDQQATTLERYSALAAADPPPLNRLLGGTPEISREWHDAARSDIETNQQTSLKIAQSLPSHVHFYDLIYHPEETIFLRHGRSTGHPTMNGKAMIINQAVIALCRHLCAYELRSRSIDTPATLEQILNVMYGAWQA